MTDRTQPEALRIADEFRECLERDAIPSIIDVEKAVAELRRQQARITDLEAQLEAIGAGGVSGPLIGQPQAMPDLSQLTERGAKAWAGVDAQGLREGFTAADMATAAAQGFRDGVASLAASAGEPVAWLYESPMPDGSVFTGASAERLQVGVGTPPSTIEKPLYLAAPPTAQAEGWIRVDERLPEPGNPVLLDIGKKYPIRALWAAKNTVRVGTDVDDWGEYDEETDEYYCPEGWYEWNEHEEVHWAVSETPRAWSELPQPLPAAPGPADGDSNV